MTDRLYHRLPFELAQVLEIVERWHDHDCNGMHACATNDLTTLADAAKDLAEWKAARTKDDRVSLGDIPAEILRDSDTQRLFNQRSRHTDATRPKLRVVPRLPDQDHDKD